MAIVILGITFLVFLSGGGVTSLIAGIFISLAVISINLQNLKSADKNKDDKPLIEDLRDRINKLEKQITAAPKGEDTDTLESLNRRLTELENRILYGTQPEAEKKEYRMFEEIEQTAPLKIKTEEKLSFEIPPPTPPPEPTIKPIHIEEVPVEKEEEKKEEEEREEEKAAPAEEAEETREEVPVEIEVEREPEIEEKIPAKEPVAVEKHIDTAWDKMQRQFIENWTGILGSIIMVVGVGFLGVYTALKLSPVYRFVMLVLFSLFLFGLFSFLKSKPKWIRLGLWLRSSAGALFLFACLGASTIDGLKWLPAPLEGLGLFLLLTGIAANLFLAFAGGKQVFASLHVLLSLGALSAAPPSTLIFVVAAVVSLFGVALTYKEKWEYHLLLTVSLFFVYHLYWYFNTGVDEFTKEQHLIGIMGIAFVGILALLVHYRKLYKTAFFERLPFFVHFANWFYLGIGLYFHSMGSRWKPAVIAGGSAAAFLLARKARRMEIRWLFLTDTLIAQIIAMIALLSLYRLNVNAFFIMGFMLLEILLFLVIMIEESETVLSAVGTFIKYGLGITLACWAILGIRLSAAALMQVRGLVLFMCALFASGFHLYILNKFGPRLESLSKNEDFQWLPYLLYFIYGFMPAAALYIFLIRWDLKPPAIALLSITAFIMAKRAKALGIRRLYQTGTLVAQVMALTALVTLEQFNVNGFHILGLMFAESLLFFLLVIKEKEKLLCGVAAFLKYMLTLILLVWAFASGVSTGMTVNHRLLETFLAVALFGTLFHFYLVKLRSSGKYREVTETGDLNWLDASTYYIHIFYAGFALYLYSIHWYWKPAALGLLSIIGFLVSKWVKIKAIDLKGVYRTGTLVAQVAILMALLALSQWNLDTPFRFGLMFIETLLFLVLTIIEKETLLRRIGTWGLFVIAAILMVITLGDIDYANTNALFKNAGTLFACVFLGTIFHIYTFKKFGETIASFNISPANQDETHNVSTIGILLGWMLLSVFINTYRMQGSEYILAAVGMLLLYIRRQYQSNGLGIGLMVFVLGFHFFGWNNMSLTDELPVIDKILYSLPFLLLTFAGIKMPYISRLKRGSKAFGIYLFYLHLMIASYYSFTRVSPFITGVLWLVFSVITLELVCWLRKKYGDRMLEKGEPDRFLMHMGYLLICAFLIRHLVVHLPLGTAIFIHGFSLRFLVALAAIFTFSYWALRRLPPRDDSGKTWIYLHPLFLELVFSFCILTVAVEANPRWFPIIWIAAALLCLIKGSRLTGETSRIRFYALLLYWASTVYVALIPGNSGSTVLYLYEKPWVINSGAIVMQFIFIILIHKLIFLDHVRFPKLLEFLSPLTDLINKRKNLWIHYPLFISVALFLFHTFDKSILTLLWVVECFLIFISAVILKENHFRYLAMTGLALALIRLVFYDLAKSNTITRALVFIGVGVLMLTMNSIYNKYKDRF